MAFVLESALAHKHFSVGPRYEKSYSLYVTENLTYYLNTPEFSIKDSGSDSVCAWYFRVSRREYVLELHSCPDNVDFIEVSYEFRDRQGSRVGGVKFDKFRKGKKLILGYVKHFKPEPPFMVCVKAYIHVIHPLTNETTNFLKPLNNEKFSDVVIKVGEEKIPAHKFILASHSSVFAAMFEHEMKEKNSNCIEIEDFSVGAVKDMISFIYTGMRPNLTFETAGDDLRISDKYAINDLKHICEYFIVHSLTVDLVPVALQLANAFDSAIIREGTADYVVGEIHLFSREQLTFILETMSGYPDVTARIIKRMADCLKSYRS